MSSNVIISSIIDCKDNHNFSVVQLLDCVLEKSLIHLALCGDDADVVGLSPGALADVPG